MSNILFFVVTTPVEQLTVISKLPIPPPKPCRGEPLFCPVVVGSGLVVRMIGPGKWRLSLSCLNYLHPRSYCRGLRGTQAETLNGPRTNNNEFPAIYCAG